MSILVQPVSARPPKVGPFPPLEMKIPEPVLKTLPMGASVYVLEDHELPIFSMSLWVRTGSLFEPADKTGLSAIFADVLRTGGTHRRKPEDLNRELEFSAASLEASAGSEEMTISLSALSKDFDRMMGIFQDVILNPAFRNRPFSLEKAKMIEGIHRRNDNPDALAGRAFRKLFYGKDHPRGREAEIQTVQNIEQRDLVRFYRTYFHPNRMIFSVSGDIRANAVVRQLGHLLERLPRSLESLPDLPASPQPSPGITFLKKDIDQSRIIMGALGIPRHSKDHFAMELANDLIGGGGVSRLFAEVRSRRGLAYSIGSFSAEHAEVGVVGTSCETKAPSTAEAIGAIRTILRDLSRGGVSPEELDLARDSLINSFVFRFSSSSQIANTYAQLAYDGYPPDYLKTYTEKLKAVRDDEVLRIVRSYWDPDRMMVLVVGDDSRFGEKLDSLGVVKRISLEP